jgi:hypothetical protein
MGSSMFGQFRGLGQIPSQVAYTPSAMISYPYTRLRNPGGGISYTNQGASAMVGPGPGGVGLQGARRVGGVQHQVRR